MPTRAGSSQRAPTFDGTARSLPRSPPRLPITDDDTFARPADVMLRTDAEHRLVLLWLPHYSDPIAPARAPRRSVLLQGVDHIEVGYWQSGPTGGGWLSTWNQPTLPQLVRIRIVFVAATRHWPDIVVAPMRDKWRV